MTATHCPYCALQCAMDVSVSPGPTGGVVVTPLDFPTNRGRLCQKGWTAADVLTTPDRLTTPLVRRDGRLRPATWDEAWRAPVAADQRLAEPVGVLVELLER